MCSTAALTQSVLLRCGELQFASAGICRAEPTSHEREILAWLAAEKHGEMEYLRRNVGLRLDPRQMVAGARSIIVVADRYSAGGNESCSQRSSITAAPPARAEGSRGRIARYAQGDDYHKLMRARLARLCRELEQECPGEAFRACVDTAPVLEREHAQRAGVGAMGKNTMLLQRGIGSYLLLGEIITTLELEPTEPAAPDPCSTCTRCIDACPTGAIESWSVDATRCISYLTIEHRGMIDERWHAAMGDWIFGCDICQEVCPHNQPTERGRAAAVHEAYTPRNRDFDLLEVLNWSEADRQQAIVKSLMKRARLNMMKRNALIAAGNYLQHHDSPALRCRIETLVCAEEEDELVRATAKQVLQRLDAGRRAPGAGLSNGSPASS